MKNVTRSFELRSEIVKSNIYRILWVLTFSILSFTLYGQIESPILIDRDVLDEILDKIKEEDKIDMSHIFSISPIYRDYINRDNRLNLEVHITIISNNNEGEVKFNDNYTAYGVAFPNPHCSIELHEIECHLNMQFTPVFSNRFKASGQRFDNLAYDMQTIDLNFCNNTITRTLNSQGGRKIITSGIVQKGKIFYAFEKDGTMIVFKFVPPACPR